MGFKGIPGGFKIVLEVSGGFKGVPGCVLRLSWVFQKFQEISRPFKAISGAFEISRCFRGGFQGMLWAFQGVSMYFKGISWISRDFKAVIKSVSEVFQECLWWFRGVPGVPRIYMGDPGIVGDFKTV